MMENAKLANRVHRNAARLVLVVAIALCSADSACGQTPAQPGPPSQPTAAESAQPQFAGLGVKVPPPSDATDAPPPLFIAIQEQLDMKLEAQKTAVDVKAIDHVDHPSPN